MSIGQEVTSPVFWKTLGAGLGGGVTATILLTILSKSWLLRRIERSVDDVYKAKEQERQAEYNVALENHKGEIVRELEGWKAGYQKALDENRIRFSRLHADRADVIRELFVLLVTLEENLGALVDPNRAKDSDDLKLNESVKKAFTDYAGYFTKNSIFFSPDDCELIEKLRDNARKVYENYTEPGIELAGTEGESPEQKLYNNTYGVMVRQFSSLRKQLTEAFRTEMGMIEAPPT